MDLMNDYSTSNIPMLFDVQFHFIGLALLYLRHHKTQVDAYLI